MNKILFYYPQHFNRSAEGTNPYFDALLKACEESNISYTLMEEPDKGTDKPRNPLAKKADGFFWFVWFLRNFAKIFIGDFFKREKMVASMINMFTLGKYKYDKYITISGSMLHLFAALNPKAQVYDMQHGVLGKFHKTFFDEEGRLNDQFYNPQIHWLFWGKGYQKCFCKGEDISIMRRSHIIGYSVPTCGIKLAEPENRNVILFSLQFTADWDKEMLEKQKRLLNEHLCQLNKCGYEVILRQHPRFNNVISIDDILQNNLNVKVSNLSFSQLLDSVLLQVTYHSTTAFEYAQMGIPTFFMHNIEFPHRENLMYNEFHYPLFQNQTLREVVDFLSDKKHFKINGKVVNKWYNDFYTDFDKETFLKLLN